MTILYTVTYLRKRGDELIEEVKHGIPGRLATTMKKMMGERFLSCVREIADAPKQRRGRSYTPQARSSQPKQKTQQTQQTQPKRPATTLAGMISEEAEKYVD